MSLFGIVSRRSIDIPKGYPWRFNEADAQAMREMFADGATLAEIAEDLRPRCPTRGLSCWGVIGGTHLGLRGDDET